MHDTANNESLYADDRHHLWHPLTQHSAYQDGGHPLIISRGQASTVYDSEGQAYLDAAAGLWCVNVGYGRKELIAAALEQLQTLAYYPLTHSHPQAIRLAAVLGNALPHVPHVYFSNSGSEANETAFKIVRQYWRQKGYAHKHKILSRFRGYHGSTLGALSATGQPERQRDYGPLAPGFIQVSAPYCYRCPFHLQYPQCQLQCATDFARRIEIEGPETVAAIIVEPVTAGGGVLIPPEDYLPEVARIARHYNVKLIVDEVVTGMGRTGTFFAHTAQNVQPDIVTMAKGLASGYMPIGATAVSQEIFEGFLDVPDSGHHFRHVSTYGGHPVACAVSLANLQLIEQENLSGAALRLGPHFESTLHQALQGNPFVGDIRVSGLLVGIEILADHDTKLPAGDGFMKQLGQYLLQHHILAGKATDVQRHQNNVLIFAPPLIIQPHEIDQIVETLRQGLNTLTTHARLPV